MSKKRFEFAEGITCEVTRLQAGEYRAVVWVDLDAHQFEIKRIKSGHWILSGLRRVYVLHQDLSLHVELVADPVADFKSLTETVAELGRALVAVQEDNHDKD